MEYDDFVKKVSNDPESKRRLIRFLSECLPEHILSDVDLTTVKHIKFNSQDGIISLLFSVKWIDQIGYFCMFIKDEKLSKEITTLKTDEYIRGIQEQHLMDYGEVPKIYSMHYTCAMKR